MSGLSQPQCVGMSSYYQADGQAWDTFHVKCGSSESEGLGAHGEDSLSRGSPEGARWTPTRRSLDGWALSPENYEMASEASSDQSWWKNESWSWHSLENSSRDGSNENWVYVTRRHRDPQWEEDAWHRWHKDGEQLRGAEGHRWGHCGPDDDGLSGGEVAADGEQWPRGELPSGKILSVHDKADKEEEKKGSGKTTSTYPPVFRAKQGENYRDWKQGCEVLDER